MKLRIHIAGLAAFVQSNAVEKVPVLFPGSMNHLPRLSIKASAVDLPNSVLPTELVMTEDGPVAVWYLRRVALSIDNPTGSGSGVGTEVARDCPTVPLPAHHPVWIAPMKEFAGCGKVDTQLLGPNPQPHLAARLDLANGSFKSESLGSSEAPAPKVTQIWGFERDDPTNPCRHTQVLTDSVLYEVKTSSGFLWQQDFGGKSGAIRLIGHADAFLLNTEYPITSVEPNQGLHHFRAYFECLHPPQSGHQHYTGQPKSAERNCEGFVGGGVPAFCTRPVRLSA